MVPPLPIDQATLNSVVDKVLKTLEDDYVFPDMATKMAQAIRKRQADHAYDDIKTGQQLAQRLTHDLQETSHDKHLRIMCSTDALPKPPGDKSPMHESPAMKARMRHRGEWINGGYRKVERLPGNIGYLAVDGFPDVEAAAGPAAAAMDFLANTDAPDHRPSSQRRRGASKCRPVMQLFLRFQADPPQQPLLAEGESH